MIGITQLGYTLLQYSRSCLIPSAQYSQSLNYHLIYNASKNLIPNTQYAIANIYYTIPNSKCNTQYLIHITRYLKHNSYTILPYKQPNTLIPIAKYHVPIVNLNL